MFDLFGETLDLSTQQLVDDLTHAGETLENSQKHVSHSHEAMVVPLMADDHDEHREHDVFQPFKQAEEHGGLEMKQKINE